VNTTFRANADLISQLRQSSPRSTRLLDPRSAVGEVHRRSVVRCWTGVGGYEYLGFGNHWYVRASKMGMDIDAFLSFLLSLVPRFVFARAALDQSLDSPRPQEPT
jgi:hypothetical protein